VAHCAPYVLDAAIAGHDRDDVAALILPNLAACRAKAGLPEDAAVTGVVGHAAVRELFEQLLGSFAAQSEGSCSQIVRAILMADRPSLELGEITDKGSRNQLATVRNHDNLVQELFAKPPTGRVISIKTQREGS
jgi:feruloyl-CoA synthase